MRFSIFIFLLSTFSAGAQSSVSYVKGKVSSADGFIPFATIAAYEMPDSVLVEGASSDADGTFKMNLKPGIYSIVISYLSYANYQKKIILAANKNMDLGIIILASSSLSLEEIVVEADKGDMQLQLDKRVFTVNQTLTNTGGSAADILDNLPSVNVDVEGNVSLRGSQNVRILIDGKPSGLSGLSSTDALRLLQSNMIERIEVITNPSARYDAEGEVGIINIVLKKDQKIGLNGAFEFTIGLPANNRIGLNLNYRRRKYNLFVSYGVNLRKTPGWGNSYQQFTLPDTSFAYQRERRHNRGGQGQNLRIGSDFFLNNKNTLTLSGIFSNSKGDNNSILKYTDFNSLNVQTQIVDRVENEIEGKENIEIGADYKKDFKLKNRVLTANAKWILSNDLEDANILQTTNIASIDEVKQRSSNTENERNWILQTDFVNPVAKDGRFEIGAKATGRTIYNDYKVEQNSHDDWVVLPGFDNNFVYAELIVAAYSMFGSKYKDLSYQAGLRAEYSDISTELIKTAEVNPRHYLNWFPSAHLSYELKPKNSIQLSYSRRLSRPRFRDLLPFSSYSDARNFRAGNPNLNPEYTHSIEAGNLRYWKNASFLTSIYYRYRTGVIQSISVADTGTVIIFIPVNLSIQKAWGLEFNTSFDLFKWMKISGNGNFYRAITDGSYNEINLHSDTYTWNGRISSKSTIRKKLESQITFDYDAPQKTTQGKQLSSYALDFAISKDLFKGNATITCSARDVFNTRRRRSITQGATFYTTSDFQWRSRQFQLTFSYRLNQKKEKQTKPIKSDSDE